MGACWVSGTYSSTDWKSGIRLIQEEAAEEYGHQDGYSGAENSCTFSYFGDMHTRSIEEVRAFLERQKEHLGSGQGGVVLIGNGGCLYNILNIQERVSSDKRLLSYLTGRKPAVAVSESRMGSTKIGEGTIADLKRLATEYLKKPATMENIVFIVSKNTDKMYVMSVRSKESDKKLTASNIISKSPIYKYGYFGWCRE